MKNPSISVLDAAGRAGRWLAASAGALALAGALMTSAQAQPVAAPAATDGMGHRGGPQHAMAHRGGHDGHGHGMAHRAMLSDRALDSVGASAEQKTKVHEILTRAHEAGRQQQLGERALHEQMRGLMSAPQVDAAAAESLRQRLQAGRDAASKRHLQAMLDASAVLTAEQRQKLAQKGQARREMMERHPQERDQQERDPQERRSLAPHG